MPDTLKAQDVLDRMAKAYACCSSYRDRGSVKTVFFIKTTGNQTVEKPFKTAFVRPDRFRFEYAEKQGGRANQYIVWQNGKEVQTWWDIKPGIKQPESLGLALAGATGVSDGSAHTVPALLLPEEVGGRRLTDLTDAKRGDDSQFDEADCFRIDGTFADNPMSLWIDKKTFLVRRIDSTSKFDTFSTKSITIYDPVIDEEVPGKALEFDLPKER